MPKPTVLIVDSDRQLTRQLSEVFADCGWKVLCERDGDWALKTFMSRRIDTVILDASIPERDGTDVIKAIRSKPRGGELPIVMLAGDDQSAENRQEAIERYGLVDCVAKPVDGERLCELLSETLTKQRMAREPHLAPGHSRRSLAPGGTATDAGVGFTAQVLAREPVSLRGNLGQTPLPRLLHELYKLQLSGALYLMHGNVKKIVFLSNGQPVYIKSNLLGECLGQLLTRQGRISAEQCEASVVAARISKRLQGAVLVEMGLLTEADLADALRMQLETKLFEIFSWTRGQYHFKENATPPGDPVVLRSNSAMVIMLGMERYYPPARLEREILPRLNYHPAAAADPFLRFQHLDLTPEQEAVAGSIDGSRTVRQLLDDERWSRESALPLVVALVEAGVVDLFDRPVRMPPIRSTRRRETLYGADSTQAMDEAQLQEHLAAEVLTLKKADHFRALGLPRDAVTSLIEEAFDEQAWRFHPEGFVGAAPGVRDLAETLFNRLRDAYRMLRSPFRRERYLEQLGTDPEAADPDEDGASRAARFVQQGKQYLAAGRYEQAAWHLRRALALSEDDPLVHAELGWAVHKAGPTDHMALQEAQRHLERALQLEPQLDVAHFYLGHLYLSQDDAEHAREHFQKALRCNPDNVAAAEQLALL